MPATTKYHLLRCNLIGLIQVQHKGKRTQPNLDSPARGQQVASKGIKGHSCLMTEETNIQFWISMWINPSLCKQMQQTKQLIRNCIKDLVIITPHSVFSRPSNGLCSYMEKWNHIQFCARKHHQPTTHSNSSETYFENNCKKRTNEPVHELVIN